MMPIDVGPKPSSKAVYLGDGLFAAFDGYQFELFAHDGIRKTNVVYLEPDVLTAFMRYVHKVETSE